ncbi:MAG: hypothetical protein R2911_22705 [Caldilineaceae bacterium]
MWYILRQDQLAHDAKGDVRMTSAENEQLDQNALWQLHLRKAKGELLTDVEQQQLAAWYARQEQAERDSLRFGSNQEQGELLQSQIDIMLEQIATATAQIQKLTDENKQLRREIMRLERQLAQHTTLLVA